MAGTGRRAADAADHRAAASERELRATLPRLTAVEDGVSLAVKQQYEENPYPRWITAGPAGARGLDRRLPAGRSFPPPVTGRSARPLLAVLIAGCGTGQHAIETAQRFADADVLAIDLSRGEPLLCAAQDERARPRQISTMPPPTSCSFDGAGRRLRRHRGERRAPPSRRSLRGVAAARRAAARRAG